MLLFVGINPFGFGAVSKLNRSINDAKRMIIFLAKNYEFNNWEISSSAYWQMNKDQDFLAWLHDGTKAGNLLIFYYSSGHGGSVKDKGGKKNMDKYLCLVDYQETG